MTDDPANSRTNINRVSIRAVLAFDGEDVTQALSQAGIFDPVVVPVTLGPVADPPGGILGDGVTPNLTGTIELDEPDGFGRGAEADQGREGGMQPLDEPVATRAQAAYGTQSFAPMRGRRR